MVVVSSRLVIGCSQLQLNQIEATASQNVRKLSYVILFELMVSDKYIRHLSESDQFSGVRGLIPIGMDARKRKQLFQSSVEDYARRLDIQCPGCLEDLYLPKFLEETEGEPLYIHMAAISILRGNPVESLSELLFSSLLREKMYWARVLSHFGMGRAYWEGFSQVIAAITIVGGIQSHSKVIDILQVLPKTKKFTPEEHQKIRAALSLFLSKGEGIDALRPDRLGEVLVLDEFINDTSYIASLDMVITSRGMQQNMLAVLERISSRSTRQIIKIEEFKGMQNHLFNKLRPRTCLIISNAVKNIVSGKNNILEKIASEIIQRFNNERFMARISISKLTEFEIYKKMKTFYSFNYITNLFSFEIIVSDQISCYRAVGLVHSVCKPVPGRFIDFIAIPHIPRRFRHVETTDHGEYEVGLSHDEINAIPLDEQYRALHTTVYGPNDLPLTFYICSEKMHKANKRQTLRDMEDVRLYYS